MDFYKFKSWMQRLFTSVDNAIPRWDGTTGNKLKGSGVLIDDNDLITHTQEGDQFYLSQDLSPFRTGSWSITTSGTLYTLVGELIMFYQSHNFAISSTGNILGRDEAETCWLTVWTESGKIKYYTAPTGIVGSVPTFSLEYQIDIVTGTIYSGLTTLQHQSGVVDGASAVGFDFQTVNTFSTAGHKVFRIRNNTAELFYVGGSATYPYGSLGTNTITNYGFGVGSGNTLTNGGFAQGAGNQAISYYTFCSGYGNIASSNGANSLGLQCQSTNLYTISMGFNSIASGSFALALGMATASGNQSVGIGTGATATGGNSLGVGYYVTSGALGANSIGGNLTNRGLNATMLGTGLTAGLCVNTRPNAIYMAGGYDLPLFFLEPDYRSFIDNPQFSVIDSTTPVGSEFVTNGTFTGSATGWTLGSAWSYSANTVVKNIDGTSTLTQVISGLEVGCSYYLVYDYLNSTVANQGVTPSLVGASGTITFHRRIVNQGSVYEVFTAKDTSYTLTFLPTNTSRFALDNVSIYKLEGGMFTTNSDSYFSNVNLQNGKNINFTTTTGSKIGAATTQKLAFWNATPIVQPVNTTAIDTLLVNTGLRASGGTANFDTAITAPSILTTTNNSSITTLTTNTTIGNHGVVLCDATSAAFTVTLPAISGISGRQYTIKKIDSSTNAITIDGNASETIDGTTTKVIALQYDSITIICDSTGWYII